MLSNKEISEKNWEKVSHFKSAELKKVARTILDDQAQDKYFFRKRFVFVDSFGHNTETSIERFVYYMYNYRENFSSTTLPGSIKLTSSAR